MYTYHDTKKTYQVIIDTFITAVCKNVKV